MTPEEAANHVWKKRPLLLHEVPLPPGGGFTHKLLDPEYKKQQAEEHYANVACILEESVNINRKVKLKPEFADVVMSICERDIEWWIDHFVWVHEPRQHEDRPLILYDFQRLKIVRPYVAHRDTVPPARSNQMKAKSRDLGLTWTELACRVHSFGFKDNWSILLGGVTQKDVDDGGNLATHKSMMGKVRFIIRKLPKWMRDRLFGPKWDSKDYSKKLLQLNPMKPNNLIEGVQVGEMFGRGGRYSEAFIDEFAYAASVKAAEKALKQTTTRFCGVSTPAGRGNLFEQLMFSSEMSVVQYWFWWAEAPGKDLLWYNLERENMEADDVASELDVSFDESAGDRVLPDIHIPQFFLTRKGGAGPDIDEPFSLWEPGVEIRVTIDFGASHPMAAVWSQWFDKGFPPFGTIIDFAQTQGKSVDWIVPLITGKIPKHTWRGDPWPHVYSPEEMKIIARHLRWGTDKLSVYGDWQGSTPNLVTGKHSAFDELEKYGISVTRVKVLDDYESIVMCNQLMRHMRGDQRLVTQRNNDPKWCPTLAEVVTQWKYPKPQPGMTSKSLTPVHDRYCHGGDCLKMLALTIDIPDSDVVMSVDAGKIAGKRDSDIVRNRFVRR